MEATYFSLTNRGPFDRLLTRIGLVDSPPRRLALRAFAPALIVWIPLFALALLFAREDSASDITFLEDVSTHVRFLVVVPLLVLVETSIGRRTRLAVRHLASSGLIGSEDRSRLEALIASVKKPLDSSIAELVIAAMAFVFVLLAVHGLNSDGALMWFEEKAPYGERLSLVGWWYALVSALPSFLLLRWVWRYAIWCWFLLRVSRLDLQIIATHPDRVGGLGFVRIAQTAFAPLGLAVSCAVSAAVATQLIRGGATLASHQVVLIAFVVMAAIVGVTPLVVFRRPLRMARERALLRYGSFSYRFVRDFEDRWVGNGHVDDLMDAGGDIQGLADIGAGFERVATMRLSPIDTGTVATFAAAATLPMVPLVLTVVPLGEALKLLMKALM